MVKRITFVLLMGILASLTACGSGTNGGTTMGQAETYLNEGDYRGAMLTLKNILKENPEDKMARLLLGKVYLPTGDGASAEKELRKAEQLGASPNEVLASLGRALLLQGKTDEVLSLLKPLDNADKKVNAEILSVKGNAFLAKGNQADAKLSYQQAIDLDPVSSDALQGLINIAIAQNKLDQASQRLEELLRIAPKDAETSNLQGLIYARKQQYAEAEASYQKAIELLHEKQLSRVGFSVRSGLVQAQLVQGKFDKALENVEQLIKAQPKHPSPKYMRALIAYEQKDYKLAQENLRGVIRVMPAHLPSRLLMGSVQYALGNYEQAREHLQYVVTEVPGHIQARKMLAAVHFKQRNPDDALKVLKENEGEGSADTQLLAMMGKAALFSGDLSGSLALYRKAAEQSPDEPSIRAELARLYLSQGSYQDAIQELEHIGGKAETQAKRMIVYAHIREQAYDKAMAVAQELAADAPNDASIPTIFGVIELSQGERGKAREHFLKSRSMSAGFEPALLSLARMDYEEGKLNEAESWYDEIILKNSKSLPALLGMAQISDRRGDTAQALVWVEKAAEANPEALFPVTILVNYHLKAKQYEKADEIIARAEQHQPENLELKQLKAKSLFAQGKHGDVIQILAELIKQQPKNPSHYLQMAKVHEQKNDLNQARATLLKAMEKIEGSEALTVALVKVETRLGNFDEAHRIIQGQKQKWSDKALAYGLEGDVYLQQKQYKSAQQAFQKGLTISDSHMYAAKLAIAKQRANDMTGAKSVIKQWVDKHPKDSRAHLTLAQLYMQLGANQDAIELYEKIDKALPKNPIVLNNLAWLYHLENDNRALATAEVAYQLAPQSSGILDTYGWLLVSQGEVSRGIALLREASSLSGGNPEIQLHLASALVKEGSHEKEAKTLVQSLMEDRRIQDRTELRQLKEQVGL
jgi:putative PEP-CTERM system TPR-repeat lipoprotein